MTAMKSARLALGTVQFGLPYGLVNSGAAVAREEVREILALAWERGIDMLDTASDYGEAEAMIGIARPRDAKFRIASKAPRIGKERIEDSDLDAVRAAADRSLQWLKIETLDTLMIHHAPDLLAAGGDRLYETLVELRKQNKTRRVGVSVYDPDMLAEILSHYPIEVVQLPLNLLDQRFEKSGMLAELSKRNIEVHVRSVFLQGALLSDPRGLPKRFAPAEAALHRLRHDAKASGVTPAAVALAYPAQCAGVSRILVGVQSTHELSQNIDAFDAARALPDIDKDAYAVDDMEIIDPRRWTG
jgi:aryl-alcohol dehydrogenase-like predicted oxidoreductase